MAKPPTEWATGIAPDGTLVAGQVIDWTDGKPVVQPVKGDAVAIVPLDKEKQRQASLEEAFRRMGYKDPAIQRTPRR